MALTKKQKFEKAKTLSEKLASAGSVVLVNFKGSSVAQVTELRKLMTSSGLEYRVYKNTILKRALESGPYAEIGKYIDGPTACAINPGASLDAAKVLSRVMETNKNLKVLAGMFEGRTFTEKQVKELSELPSREELIARTTGAMKSPLYRLHYVLNSRVSGLVLVLGAIKGKKQ